MGLRGDAAIVGYAEHAAERRFTGTPSFSVEQWAELAALALADAGIDAREVDGICTAGDVRESQMFVPATIAEYCGWQVNFAEKLDLGGATPVGMVWRAAAAIELGICDVVVCATPGRPIPAPPVPEPFDVRWIWGASSHLWGSPQAEFEIPYGNVAQNCGFASYATRYHETYGWDEWARAKIAADQRASAAVNPAAVFFGRPTTPDDVLASRMISDPLRMHEIVMPCHGGAAVVVASKERARRTRHRPVFVTGFGEHIMHKTPTYTPDLTRTPVGPASDTAFRMAGVARADVDMVQIYDCYTITVLLSLEDAGFCGKGEGMSFVREHDLSYKGDFPCNTHGGQLGYGQCSLAGGMSHITEGVRQIMGRAGDRQLASHDLAYVSGTGGVMSEQSALILQGDDARAGPAPEGGAMGMIETCRGPIAPEELGVTLAHEHLHVHSDGIALNFPRVYDRDAIVEAAVARVNDVVALGAQSMIDLTVLGIGRDITIARDVAARVPMHIVVATGAYFFDQLPGFFRGRPTEALAEQFVLDITEGIAGTSIKAAVLKCPTDAPGVTPDNDKLLRAIALAHRETGTPISTHTHAGLHRGRDQVRVFREEGVDLSRVVIGHCGDTDDIDYLYEIADTGAFLGMDRFGYDANLPLDRRVKAIVDLCARGHASQIVVSHDYCCHIDWFPHPIAHPSMTYLFTEVLPALRAGGLDDATIDQFLVHNPRRFLAGG